jgi:hypothetical protein
MEEIYQQQYIDKRIMNNGNIYNEQLVYSMPSMD